MAILSDSVTRMVLVVGVGVIILTMVERMWRATAEVAVALGVIITFQLRTLRRCYETAPGLLPWLPRTGTGVTVRPAALILGDDAIPFEAIRFDHIRLHKRQRLFTNFRWESEYFLDHVTLTAGGKIIHLDATAIRSGQLILDTLCTRVRDWLALGWIWCHVRG